MLLGIIFAILLGYYIFTDDWVALLVSLFLMIIATILFIQNIFKGKSFWKSFKKWVREIWDLLYGIG